MLVAAPAALAANVMVRVEGTADTLVPRTTVATSAGAFTKDGDPSHSCSRSSAGGALEAATAGDWDGTWDGSSGDYLVQKIKDEAHLRGSLDPTPTGRSG